MTELVSLVIPVADEPRNLTLPLALRTARKHAPWLRPVLIGQPIQMPQYLLPPNEGDVLAFGSQDSHDPVGNTTRMLYEALISPLVTDPFVWSNDDIYFRDEVTLVDIDFAGSTARTPLEVIAKRGTYGRRAQATYDALARASLPTWDYERHVPLLVHKQQMREALELCWLGHPRSLYQNIRLAQPAHVERDVKAFNWGELRMIPEDHFFSTGNRFPMPILLEALGLLP